MMLQNALVASLVCCMALAGCADDGLSSKGMAAQVDSALKALPDDVGPGGVFSEARVQAQLAHLDDWAPGTADTAFNPDFLIKFGLDDDLLGTMSFFGVSVEFFCHPDAVGIVTDGMDGFNAQDISFEQRNPAAACLDITLDQAVDAFGDDVGQVFSYLVDPTSLLAVPTSLEQVGKDVHATYKVPGASVNLIAGPKHIKQLIVEVDEPEGRFVIKFIEGTRSALALPEPDERLASVVSAGQISSGDFGYRWIGDEGDAQVLADYEIRVYDTSANVRCGGDPAQIVATFDLGDGTRQTKAGYTLDVSETGNGKLGSGDLIHIQHPNLSQDWDDQVVIWDQWADRSAHRLCQ